MKVLEIEATENNVASLIPGWEEAEVVTTSSNPDVDPDYLTNFWEIPHEEEFDALLASHVLQRAGWFEVPEVLEDWKGLLKPGGELHIIVPSLEWAAREILSENPSPALFPHLYGGQQNESNVHHSGFTMRYLRVRMAKSGFKVQRARTGGYEISVQGGKHKAHQHYIMGVAPME